MCSHLEVRQRRSMKALSVARPRPSRLMRQPAASRACSYARLVNWLPWSELKMYGAGAQRKASARVWRQKLTSSVLENYQLST